MALSWCDTLSPRRTAEEEEKKSAATRATLQSLALHTSFPLENHHRQAPRSAVEGIVGTEVFFPLLVLGIWQSLVARANIYFHIPGGEPS